jgi:hypothetical protein
MRDIQELLRTRGVLSALYPLPGHRKSWLRLARMDLPQLVDAAIAAAGELRRVKEARSLRSAYLVAHSLGALAFLSAMMVTSQREPCPFDKALLLAPAFGLRRRALLLRGAATSLPGWIPIPSLSSRRDSRYPFLPLGAYRLLYELLDSFNRAVSMSPWELPSRIYIDPADEFLSVARVRGLLRGGALRHAQLVVAPGGEGRQGPAHLMVDRGSMGELLWRDLARQVG